jgi:glucose/arabinose dehydrogenase
VSKNSPKLILAGGILGLVFLIIFGLFLSDVELEYIEKEKPKIDEIELPSNVNQIINALESGKQLYPDWFQNDIAQVRTGQITSKEFLDTYYYLSDQGTIYTPITARTPPLPTIYDDDYIIEKFVSGLNLPTAMTFVGEDILVLEKNTGKVIRIQDNGIIYTEPVLDVPVEAANESGLLGITSMSNHVFLYFSESESGFDTLKRHDQPIKNKVYRYDWNGENLINPILIKELPGLHTDHAGGVITKGLNNEIYFVIGDQEQRTTFQNIHADATYETGGIFKIDTESNNSVELFAMGIRNSFGLAVDPITGYLWETENASERFDEINLVKPGFNSGWVSIMGPADRVDSDLSTVNKIFKWFWI